MLTHLAVFYTSRVYCYTSFEHDVKPASDYLIVSLVLGNALTSAYFWGTADKTSAIIVTTSCTSLTFGYLAWLKINNCRTTKTGPETPLLVLESLHEEPGPEAASDVRVHMHVCVCTCAPECICVHSIVCLFVCMHVCITQVTNSGTSKAEPGADEEANGTVRVDPTSTETVPAPEQAHGTPANARLQAFNPDPLQDGLVAHTQVSMPPQELHAAAAMRSEMIEAREEACMIPTNDN